MSKKFDMELAIKEERWDKILRHLSNRIDLLQAALAVFLKKHSETSSH